MSFASYCGSGALWRDHKKRKERGKISLFTSFHEEKTAISQMPVHINFAPLKAVMCRTKLNYSGAITADTWSSSIDLFSPLSFPHLSLNRDSLTCLPGRKRLCSGLSYKQTTANVLSEMKKSDSCGNNSWIVLKITLFNVLIQPSVILGSDPMWQAPVWSKSSIWKKMWAGESQTLISST